MNICVFYVAQITLVTTTIIAGITFQTQFALQFDACTIDERMVAERDFNNVIPMRVFNVWICLSTALCSSHNFAFNYTCTV